MKSATPRSSTQAPRSGPQSVGRVLAILEHVAQHKDGATLTALAAHANAPKTSLVGLIQALVQEGALTRADSGQYQLGDRMRALAQRVAPGQELTALARPFLEELVLATGETVVLGIPGEDDMAVYIDKVETDSPVRYTIHVGARRELYCSAMGKALLAYAPADQLRRVLAPGALKRFTDSTVVSPQALRKQIAAIRRDGVARTRDERVEGASGFAAPIFGPDQTAVAAILVAGPSGRVRTHAAAIERHLRQATRAITLALGGSAPPP
jgi:IclR family acetate operon transcriptional repressor